MKNHKNISKNLWIKAGAAGLLSLLLSSCIKQSTPTYYSPPVALLAFIQASPDEPALDFYLNGDRVNYYPLHYGDNLDYFKAFTGKRTANFYSNGTTNMIFSDTLTLKENTGYSLFLANTPAKPEMVLIIDTLNRPAAGNASVRFINLSPDAPAVSLAIKGSQVLATNEPFKGYTSFMPVKGNSTYTFEVRQGTTSTVLATLPNITLNDGYLYTIWFRGLAASTNANDKLSASIITNAYYY
jgi:hypothetical protein